VKHYIFDETKSHMVKTIFQTESFGRAIKQKRIIELDADLRTLSKKLKISAATLSRCEHGNMPDLLTYAMLCDWLGVSKDEFFVRPKKVK
jgi:transcriptional regulator with XRE-family HTH domain